MCFNFSFVPGCVRLLKFCQLSWVVHAHFVVFHGSHRSKLLSEIHMVSSRSSCSEHFFD